MVVIIFGTLVLHYRCGVGLNSRARWRGARAFLVDGAAGGVLGIAGGGRAPCMPAHTPTSTCLDQSNDRCARTRSPPSLPPQSLRWSIRLFTVSHSSRPGYVCVTALSQRNGVRHLHCQCFSVKWVEIGVGECVLPESAINDS